MFGKKLYMALLSAGLSACMLLTVPACAETETAEEAVEETAENAEAEIETEELVLKLTEEKELPVLNATGKKAAQVLVKKSVDEEWSENILETVIGTEEKAAYDLKLVAEDEEAFLFYNLPLSEMESLAVYTVEEGNYVIYTDADQKEVSTKEFPVICAEEPTPVYATYGLNVRAVPTTEGAILGGLQPGEEAARYGVASNGWCMIKRGDGYAFITGDYVTESAEEAEKIREQARAAAEAAAAAAQSSGSSSGGSNSGSGSSGSSGKPSAPEKTEVSREMIPGCDDPDHGMIYITYSDGSMDVVEY